MDDFLTVLRKGAVGTGKGPVLVAAGLVVALLSAIGLVQYTDFGQALISDTADLLLPSLLVVTLTTVLPLVVTPYVLGGALGYALAQSSGDRPGWKTFFAAARAHYTNLFFAGIIAYILYAILLLALVFTASTSVLCCLLPVAALVVFVILMAIEFYDIVIVAEGADFIKCFSASVAFVRKNFRVVVPFFIIAIIARFLVQLPIICATELKFMAEFFNNYSYYFNETANGTNMSLLNTTQLASQVITFSVPSLLALGLMQVILHTIVFAFLVSYKAEFYRWAKSIKRITDFDYEFPDEKKGAQ